ncbi:MAG: prepilin-type N-terminal cleavage/methylation domain-containing protein [Desulfobacteraceae bacterium]|nr:prepilin-type N-terminal cleavage/methylation domain-containing protein [Desulfobacteraceae bacterium]
MKLHQTIRTLNNSRGFSLIELMVAIAIFSIVVTTIVAAFQSQLRSHITQQQVADMQQNGRGAMALIKRDLRDGGWPPNGDANTSITTTPTSLIIVNDFHNGLDDDGDGVIDDPEEKWMPDGDSDDFGERIVYTVNADNELTRNGEPLGLNIEVMDIVLVNAAGTPAAPDDMVAAQISLIARAGEGATPSVLSNKHTDTREYRNKQDEVILPAQNDLFRRMILTTEVKLRNYDVK